MDTDAIRLFVLASETLNIGAAGRKLGLAPSVASAWLAKLERSVGADLLHRSTRKVALSTEGAEFLPYARDIIAREDAARAALGQGSAMISGTLRFTAPSTFAELYIAPILPEFLSDHPDITLDLRLSDQQFDLIEGSFDLALRNAPLQDSTLRGRKLADDTRILCAAPEYIAQRGLPASPEDLAAHAFIAFGREHPIKLKGRDGKEASFNPAAGQVPLVIDDGSSLKRATVAGAGISANSLWSVHKELAEGRLQRILPDFRLVEETPLWLLYPQSNVLSAKVRVFMDFLLLKIGNCPPWLES